MRFHTLSAALVAGAAFFGTAAVAVPAGATGSSQPATIIDALAASAANNPAGSATDHNWNDLDILLAAAAILPFDGLNPDSPTIAEALVGFTGTVFAPADASFRGLVADLTNTPIWKLTEADVLNVLLAIAGQTFQVNGSSVPGTVVLSETVKYHATVAQIPDLRRPASRGVVTLTQLPALGLSDGMFEIKRPLLGLVGLADDDPKDLDPFWFGRTVRTADGGTIHVIAGVLRPLDLVALFPLD